MTQFMERTMWTTVLLFWSMLDLSLGQVSSQVSNAQELTISQVDPTFLLKEYTQDKEDEKKVESMLRRYAKGSKYVIVGQVQTINRLSTGEYLDQEAYIQIDGWMRGMPEEAPSVLRIEKQYNAPYLDNDWDTVTGVLVEGYSVLIFLDNDFHVVEGNAIFYTDGEYLWRNKRNSNFLHPHYDREWTKENPYDDYVVLHRTEVKDVLLTQKPATWLR